jgi:hypothetical protein
MKLIFMFTIAVLSLHAQAVQIADTIGKGKKVLFVSPSAIVAKDFTTLAYSFAQVGYGVSTRADVYVGASENVVFGQKQTAIIGGANVTLFRPGPVSVSAYNQVGTALNRRKDAATATLYSALLVSLTLNEKKPNRPTPYTGYSVLVPLGNTEGKVFTPSEPMHNIPIGIMIPRGHWALFAEYGFGKKQQTVSMGVGYVF